MRSEVEIRKRLSALEGLKALVGSDVQRVDVGIRTLKWVLGEEKS